MLQADSILVVRGRVCRRDDGMNLHAVQRSRRISGGGCLGAAGHLDARAARHRPTRCTALGDVLIRHAGDTEVRLRLVQGSTAQVFEVPVPGAGDRRPVRRAEGPARAELPRVTPAPIGRSGRLARREVTALVIEQRQSSSPSSPYSTCTTTTALLCTGKRSMIRPIIQPVTSFIRGRPSGPLYQWSPAKRRAIVAGEHLGDCTRLRTPEACG